MQKINFITHFFLILGNLRMPSHTLNMTVYQFEETSADIYLQAKN